MKHAAGRIAACMLPLLAGIIVAPAFAADDTGKNGVPAAPADAPPSVTPPGATAPTIPATPTVIPDLSVHLPARWFGCADASRRGEQQAEARQLCELVSSRFNMHFVDFSTANHMSLGLAYRADKDLHDLLTILGPDLLPQLNAHMCAGAGTLPTTRRLKATGCDLSIRTIGERKALGVLFTVEAKENATDLYKLLLLMLPHKDGVLLVSFGSHAGDPAADDAVVQSVVNSLGLEDVPAVAAPEIVRVSPAPDISLGIPKGWIACDEDDNARLGNVEDSSHHCRQRHGEQYMAFDPVRLETVVMLAGYSSERRIRELHTADGGQLPPEASDRVCAAVIARMPRSEYTYSTCSAEITTISGHQSFFMRMVAVTAAKPDIRFESRVYVLPYERGEAILIFLTPVLFKARTEPLIDSIVGSIEVGPSI